MIDKLTKEQEALIPVYRDKWLKNGLATGEIDIQAAKEALYWCFDFMDKDRPSEVEVLDSPKACQLAANRALGNEKFEMVQDLNIKYWWSGFYGFYDFVLNELFPEKKKDFPLFDEVKKAVMNMPYTVLIEGKAFMSHNPEFIHKDEQGRLHCAEGPAIRYADGFSVYALDGVRVNKQLFDKVLEQEDAEGIMAIENVEVRLVCIKYFGIGNMRAQLKAETIEDSGVYELYSIELMGQREKVLRMKNPSEDKWHDEFVPPNTSSIKEALALRWGLQDYVKPLFEA